jgi:hypothetical protein
MVIRYRGLAGTMTYRSFHAAATWTFSEGERRLRRVRYREPPEGVFLGSGTRQKCVSSAADNVERLPASGRKAEAPLPAYRFSELSKRRIPLWPSRSSSFSPARREEVPLDAVLPTIAESAFEEASSYAEAGYPF